MSEFDLVVQGGEIVDGTGAPRVRGGVGIKDGVITAIGRVDGSADRTIDADGHVVTPGFIDGHTHMDAQVFWDSQGSCSSWHGVTSVVMGNCGFTLGPARPDARALVVRNLERAEDISPAALAEGIDWTWESYREYLAAVDALPKSINYAGYVGHSALRTWAMGERAFEAEADETDLKLMAGQLEDALDAGALGLSTSRSDTHMTSDGRPVASRLSSWEEIQYLAGVVGRSTSDGLFQLSVEQGASSPDSEVRHLVFERLTRLSLEQHVGVTFGIISPGDAFRWRGLLDTIDRTNSTGGRMFGQSLPREATIILSFQSRLPYDRLPVWSDFRSRPLDVQQKMLGEPDWRAALIEEARRGQYTNSTGATVRPPDYDTMRAFVDPVGPNPTVSELARTQGKDPIEVVIDMSLQRGLDMFFTQTVGNPDESEILEMLTHPEMIPTFSDSGAHVGYIMESSIQTYLLGYWVRRRQELSLERAVQMMTSKPAKAWGFQGRGVIAEGMIADLNVLDPDTVGPGPLGVRHDLPAGESRLVQGAKGIRTTIVAGQTVWDGGVHTGALPGRVIRRGRS